jgi:hypothetical protein
MIEINLLPDQMRQRTQPSAKRPSGFAPVPKAFPLALLVLSLLMGLLTLVSSGKLGASQRKSRQVDRELRDAKAEATEAERVREAFPALAGRYMVLASRLNGKINWTDVLRVVSLRCPSGVLITSLKLERDRTSGRPVKFVIRGTYAGTSNLELRFADGLKESTTFTEVFEAVIPERSLMPDDRTSFALLCLFRPFSDELVDAADLEGPEKKEPAR